MSDAIPDIAHKGFLLPDVYALAKAINASGGWHVSSGYRPCGPFSPTHSKGMSLDVVPLTFQDGGFGLGTARRILDFASLQVPDTPWMCIAERDHIHISRSNRPGIGYNKNGRTYVFDPYTQKELEITMNQDSMKLDDRTWGDLRMGDALTGDALTGDALTGDLGMGDVNEQGDSRVVRAVAQSPNNPQVKNLVLEMTPAQREHVKIASAVRKAQQAFALPYEYCQNGVVRNSTVGTAKMGRSEAEMMRYLIHRLPACPPLQKAFSYDASTATWYMNVSIAYWQMLQNTTHEGVYYPGGIIIISANQLNIVPDTPAYITRTVPQDGGRATQVNTLQLQLNVLQGSKISTRLFYANAQTIQARPRLTAQTLTTRDPVTAAYPIPATHAGIMITNVPANYSVSFAPFNPVDTFTSDYLKNLP